jgi:two-component system, response regulator YesN
MFKVLIIDDEPLVREGLKTIIDWQDLGFYICGEGTDGKDGLKKIFDLDPDLILADIKMPGLNGIELVEKAREEGYGGKVVILTGYSEFEYAKKAIRLDVKSYLLKPIIESELIEIVEKVRDELQLERQREIQLNSSTSYLREQVVKDIATGRADFDNLDMDIALCGLNYDFNLYHIAVIGIISNPGKVSEDVKAVRTFIEECMAGENMDMFLVEDITGIIYKGIDLEEIIRGLRYLHKQLKEGKGISVFTAVGRGVSELCRLEVSYRDARFISERRFLYEDLDIAVWEHINNSRTADKDLSFDAGGIYTCIEIGDSEKLDKIFSDMEEFFKQSELPVDKIKGICVNCIMELKEKFVVSYPDHKDSFLSNEVIVNNIYSKRNLRILLDYIKSEFNSVSKQINNSTPENTMKRIVNYIEKNYSKDLKLEVLAGVFGYNSSYLGKAFKNFTGISFNTYLDKVRIENAKSLLEDNLKVYQVSEKVGFRNINYFYSKFKKHVGISPQEYKKQ